MRSSQGHIEDVCKISRFESKKRRRHSPGRKFGFFNVNQPVTASSLLTVSPPRSCRFAPLQITPKQIADIEKAVSLRKEAVSAASRAVVPPSASPASLASAPGATAAPEEQEPCPVAPWSLRGDTDGPDPALWALTSAQETSGLAEKLELWGVRGRGGGGGDGATAGTSAGVEEGLKLDSGSGVERREWPRRVRLRTRLGMRCRKDLAAGRAGILIKATFNPLEGDSSGAKASFPPCYQ